MHAPSDPQRRSMLAEYYNHLYDRMIKLEPTLTAQVNMRRQISITRLKYIRIGEDDVSFNEDSIFAPAPEEPSGPNPPQDENTQQPTQ